MIIIIQWTRNVSNLEIKKHLYKKCPISRMKSENSIFEKDDIFEKTITGCFSTNLWLENCVEKYEVSHSRNTNSLYP